VAAENFTSWQEGDHINCYMLVTKSQRLEDAKATTAVDLAALGVS
jgi:translation initiation factor IF-2